MVEIATQLEKYNKFLSSKLLSVKPSGFIIDRNNLPSKMFEFQKDIVVWALQKGKAAIFALTGLGKTLMQLTWANEVCNHTNQNVLILAPLGVTPQTVREGKKFGIEINLVTEQSEVKPGINITNYEKLHKFNINSFVGIVLDESSILKDHLGKTTNLILDLFRHIPYKLSCTATPSPNDYMELGTQAEFLGIMSRSEMLSMFFVHDGGNVSSWRLKGHAEIEFWKWICTWACFISHPRDLGYDEKGFDLPKLNIYEIVVEVECKDLLFPVGKLTLEQRRNAKKDSIQERIDECAKLVNNSRVKPWLIWCKLNDEGDRLEKALNNAVQIAGKDSNEFKEKSMIDFADNRINTLVTKPEIAGKGMNWQNCCNSVFVGLGDSFEEYFQAIRRLYRFGQVNEVNIYIVTSSAEGAIVDNVKRKERDFIKMSEEVSKYTRDYVKENLTQAVHQKVEYKQDTFVAPSGQYKLLLGDCIQRIKEIPDNSIDFSVFSPPFSSLYTYSNLIEDMGNCKGKNEFYKHFKFLVTELMRVIKPGRLVAVHCMNLQRLKERDGDMGIEDFRGDLIRMFLNDEVLPIDKTIETLGEKAQKLYFENKFDESERLWSIVRELELQAKEIRISNPKGFVFHSEVCIWKDPVTAMQRTKSLKLLHKQLKKDSSRSANGLADYVLVFMKPGENANPIAHTPEEFPVSKWQRYASPVWMDINPSNTLQKESAREAKDERHIAPLQLEVISRLLELWTNPGDLVFSPFAGIGSEIYQAIKMKRKGLGIELKQSYWKQAVLNCQRAEIEANSGTLFDLLGDDQGESFGEVEQLENEQLVISSVINETNAHLTDEESFLPCCNNPHCRDLKIGFYHFLAKYLENYHFSEMQKQWYQNHHYLINEQPTEHLGNNCLPSEPDSTINQAKKLLNMHQEIVSKWTKTSTDEEVKAIFESTPAIEVKPKITRKKKVVEETKQASTSLFDEVGTDELPY